jgi:hypothetical protein
MIVSSDLDGVILIHTTTSSASTSGRFLACFKYDLDEDIITQIKIHENGLILLITKK